MDTRDRVSIDTADRHLDRPAIDTRSTSQSGSDDFPIGTIGSAQMGAAYATVEYNSYRNIVFIVLYSISYCFICMELPVNHICNQFIFHVINHLVT